MLKRKASIYVYITSFVSAAALIFGLFAVIALPFALYFAYCIVRYRRPADPEARAAVRNGDGVIVEEAWWGFAFLPCPIEATSRSNKGLIYFQGALVDHAAYAPMCHDIAIAARATVVVLKSPLRMAPFGARCRAEAAIDRLKHVNVWAVGGHSMGGPAAADLLGLDLGGATVAGLCLHASYLLHPLPDLETPLTVLQVLGSCDGILTKEKGEIAKQWMPAGSKVVEIEGGNHAGFGAYGVQTFPRADGERTISAADQQAAIVTATATWLKTLGLVSGRSQRHIAVEAPDNPRLLKRQSSSMDWLGHDASPFSPLARRLSSRGSMTGLKEE